MIRRLGVAIALAGLLAGCGSRTAVHALAHRNPAGPQAGGVVRPRVAVKPWHVVVTVVDGDTGARVRGALVEAGKGGEVERISPSRQYG